MSNCKLTVKNNKQAFTLIELVVVIAILAIIAAIAIPSVIMIVSSASQSKGDTDARALREACEEFYSEITAGQITTSNFTKDSTSTMTVPQNSDTSSYKRVCAGTANVVDVLNYYGYPHTMIDSMYYATASTSDHQIGDIFYSEETVTDAKKLTLNTQLKNILTTS